MFAVLALFTILSTAQASDCTDRNVQDDPGSPLNSMPIYDQGNTTLCYAYTAAQLTEYFLRDSGQWPLGDSRQEDHLDPLWFAMLYKDGHSLGIRIRKNQLGNGYIHTALRDVRRGGICDPRFFRAEFDRFKGNVRFSDPNFLLLYEGYWERRRKNPVESFKNATESLLSERLYRIVLEDFYRVSLAPRSAQNPTYEIPPVAEAQLREVFERVASVPLSALKKEKISYLRDTVFAACKGSELVRPEHPDSKGYGIGFASNAKLKAKIDAKLDGKKAEPVGIGYCATVFAANQRNATRRIGILPRIAERALDDANCGMHYSLVVGRRKNPESGKCQYLVRNTYGRDFWTKRWDCQCETADGKGFEACNWAKNPEKKNRVVGCWIDDEPLLTATYDLAVLTND